LNPLPMVYRNPYPWYFDLPIHLILTFRTHGILTLLPMVYRTPICGILTTLLMFCWTPNHGILTPTHVRGFTIPRIGVRYTMGKGVKYHG
jgi:hypothetical protein